MLTALQASEASQALHMDLSLMHGQYEFSCAFVVIYCASLIDYRALLHASKIHTYPQVHQSVNKTFFRWLAMSISALLEVDDQTTDRLEAG